MSDDKTPVARTRKLTGLELAQIVDGESTEWRDGRDRRSFGGRPSDGVDAAWSRMALALEAQGRRGERRRILLFPMLAAVGVSAAALALSLGFSQGHPTEQVLAAGHAAESADKSVSLALPDGIQAALDPNSRLSVNEVSAEEIRAGLSRGRARFEVERRGGRRFIVESADVEVAVVGTRFSVAQVPGREGLRIEVAVEQGVVEVRSRSRIQEVRRLFAGDRYSAPAAAVDAQAPLSPASLIELAQARWRASDPRGAAALYDELLERHPEDPRAALAALAVGRIRVDQLGELARAARNFERAVALGRAAGNAQIYEDALGRLVQITAQLEWRSECRRARAEYLAQFPSGIHGPLVTAACAGAPGRSPRGR